MNSETNQLLSIGMPVFNGEKFLEKSISSLLNQTYENFELLVSDNASNDKTQKICQDFSEKDKRVRYVRHKKNLGSTRNYHYVLEQANKEYFMWAAADDFWEPEFLEKNMSFLKSNKEFVSSVSLVKPFGDNEKNKNSRSPNLLFKIRYKLKPVKIESLDKTFEENVKNLLSKGHSDIMYGVFKTDALKKSVKDIDFGVGYGYAMLLNVLKFGKIKVINEVLFWKYNEGMSKSGMISFSKTNQGVFNRIFPAIPFTKWCLKNLGRKIFLKNINYFIQVNSWVAFSMFVDGLKMLVKKS